MTSRALKVLQFGAILAAGWAIGRAPAVVDAAHAAYAPPVVRTVPPARQVPDASAGLSETQAAEIAARVASQVAAETVARLVAAGWGPAAAIRTSVAEPRVIVVRSRAEPVSPPTALAGFSYDLPPASRQPALPADRSTTPAAARPDGSVDRAAFDHATDAYAALRSGERRRAAEGLARAIAMAPDAPQAGGWRADLRRLASQFRFDSYLLIRDDSVPSPAASPILGGGQLGYSVGYTPAPLSKRPIELFARGSVPYASNGRVVSRYSQGAVGVRWRFLPRVAVDVERQVGFGFAARDDWAARLAGGLDGDARAIGRAWRWDSYAEAGVVGIGESSWYAGMQGRVGTPIAGRDSVLLLGAGVWASAQGGLGADVSRVDIGPSLRLLPRKYPVQAQLDYRLQAAGNASPGSGPVLTITAGF